MKNHVLVLTCFVAVMAIVTLVAVALILYTPWQVSLPLLGLALYTATHADYQHMVGRD